MWPWEHVAFAYLAYSLVRHARRGAPPDDRAAIAVVVAGLLPDLVDKPLSWSLDLFQAGYAIGHSVVTWTVLAAIVAGSRRRRDVGAATVVGYGSHLVGDVVYPALLGDGLAFRRVLWPLVTLPPYDQRLGLLSRTFLYLRRYLDLALAGELGVALAVEGTFLLVVVGLWSYDGFPGLGWVRATGSSDRPVESVDRRE